MKLHDGEHHQQQRSGANSEQVSGGRDVVSAGGNVTILNIGEGQAYLDATRPGVVAREYATVGEQEAMRRVLAFDENLLKGISELGRLSSLADPAYQKTLNSARISAAATDRSADSERLVILMSERAAEDGRIARAAISRAVHIIDDVDEDALAALRWYWGGQVLMPGDANAISFMETWSSYIEAIGFQDTFDRPGWLEHLHIVGAIRLDTSGAQTIRPLMEWIKLARPAFFAPGLTNGQLDDFLVETHEQTYTIPLVPHELKEGCFRLFYTTNHSISEFIEAHDHDPGLHVGEIADMLLERFGASLQDTSAIDEFSDKLTNFPVLLSYGSWRSNLESPVHITHVGRALVWASMHNVGLPMPPLEGWLH